MAPGRHVARRVRDDMTVHVIATGGTIASHWDGAEWTNIDGASLIAELGELPVDVHVTDVAAGPSSNLSVDQMVRIARSVQTALAEGADGVVVVHGTDTIELTALTICPTSSLRSTALISTLKSPPATLSIVP